MVILNSFPCEKLGKGAPVRLLLYLCLACAKQVNVCLKASCFCLHCCGIGVRGYVLAGGFSCILWQGKGSCMDVLLDTEHFPISLIQTLKGSDLIVITERKQWNLSRHVVLAWIVLWGQFLMWHDKEINVHYKWSLCTPFCKPVGHCCSPSLEKYGTVQLLFLLESVVDLQSDFYAFYGLRE